MCAGRIGAPPFVRIGNPWIRLHATFTLAGKGAHPVPTVEAVSLVQSAHAAKPHRGRGVNLGSRLLHHAEPVAASVAPADARAVVSTADVVTVGRYVRRRYFERPFDFELLVRLGLAARREQQSRPGHEVSRANPDLAHD